MHRCQLPVGDHQIRPQPPCLQSGLAQLAFAPDRGGRRLRPALLLDHAHRFAAGAAHQSLQLRDLPPRLGRIGAAQAEQQHPLHPGRSALRVRIRQGLGEVAGPGAQIRQVAFGFGLPWRLAISRAQQQGWPAPAWRRVVAVAQPGAGTEVERHQCLARAGLQLGMAAAAVAGDQAQLAGLVPFPAAEPLPEPSGAVEIPHPEQPAQAARIQNQAERQLQLPRLLTQPLQGEQIGKALGWMAPVAEPLQLPPLRGTQPRRAAAQHPLPHGRRTSTQGSPAARAPASSSGLSPTCQA